MKHIKRMLGVAAMLSVVLMFVTPTLSAEPALRMATTTSTDNTGLLDYLSPKFKADTGIDLQWVAVGTGKALELGKNCDVDVLLVLAPGAEIKYVADGFGVDRRQVMYNDFIVIGPKDDPAGIKGNNTKQALATIAKKNAQFASRGDNSGTHKKELGLWKTTGMPTPDKESWYIQTGQGMINTITVAAERNAYTLADRGTYIKYESNFKGNPPLVILVEGDAMLRNQYSVLAVNPAKCPNVKYDTAQKFAKWMISDPVQKLIGDFQLMGKQMFIPNANE